MPNKVIRKSRRNSRRLSRKRNSRRLSRRRLSKKRLSRRRNSRRTKSRKVSKNRRNSRRNIKRRLSRRGGELQPENDIYRKTCELLFIPTTTHDQDKLKEYIDLDKNPKLIQDCYRWNAKLGNIDGILVCVKANKLEKIKNGKITKRRDAKNLKIKFHGVNFVSLKEANDGKNKTKISDGYFQEQNKKHYYYAHDKNFLKNNRINIYLQNFNDQMKDNDDVEKEKTEPSAQYEAPAEASAEALENDNLEIATLFENQSGTPSTAAASPGEAVATTTTQPVEAAAAETSGATLGTFPILSSIRTQAATPGAAATPGTPRAATNNAQKAVAAATGTSRRTPRAANRLKDSLAFSRERQANSDTSSPGAAAAKSSVNIYGDDSFPSYSGTSENNAQKETPANSSSNSSAAEIVSTASQLGSNSGSNSGNFLSPSVGDVGSGEVGSVEEEEVAVEQPVQQPVQQQGNSS